MTEQRISQLLQAVRMSEDIDRFGEPYRSIVMPYLIWDLERVEKSLSVKLPADLQQFWNMTSSLVMYWDVTDGQWGLVLWSPDQILVRHPWWYSIRRLEDWRPGDLIIGEFLGDSDLPILRCDPTSADFGTVLISSPLESRSDWAVAAPTLCEFLEGFWKAMGEKYWEVHTG